MRELIIEAIHAELARQAVAPNIAGIFDGSVERLADAVLAEVGRANAPDFDAMAERLSAIADRMEATLVPKGKLSELIHEMSAWEHPRDPDAKVEFVKPFMVTAEQRQALKWVRDERPITQAERFGPWGDREFSSGMDQRLRWFDRLLDARLIERAHAGKGEKGWRWTITPLGLEALFAEPVEIPAAIFKPEPAIECTPAERTALRSVASRPQGYLVLYGSDAVWGGRGLVGGRASANDLVARGLLSKEGERGEITYFITPLGLRAIEQEPL